MKILFSTGDLEHSVSANNKIVLSLAAQLVRMGHDCAVCGVCNAFAGDEIADGVLVKRMPAATPVLKAGEAFEVYVKNSRNRNTARREFMKKHPLHSAALFLKYRNEYVYKLEQPRYLKQLKAFANEFKPDVIVVVCKPVNAVQTVVNGGFDCPVFYYQLDPWGLHRIDNPKGSDEVIAKECAVFDKVKHIFTTPILQSQYSQRENYQEYLGKMEAVEFPNIREYKAEQNVKAPIEFDGEYTNVLFCGVVTDEFRSPKAVLGALEQSFKAGDKIRVYFLGNNMSRDLDGFIERYPDNVFSVDAVSADKAFAAMESADALLNISNSIDNQVPSKIFDYFSMGKPIVNLQKIENCPAMEYFDKYPLAFNIEEWKAPDSAKLLEFLKSAKGQRLSFEKVKEIYREATVEYVAQRMEKAFLK